MMLGKSVLEMSDITVNKNSIIGDTSALSPGGVRLGTPALTTRGFMEKDIETVAEMIHRGIEITVSMSNNRGNLDSFEENDDIIKAIVDLKNDVNRFASVFPIPGL